jgi:hypothetical protein
MTGNKAFLARIVDEGPIPAVYGVVLWRACDLIAAGASDRATALSATAAFGFTGNGQCNHATSIDAATIRSFAAARGRAGGTPFTSISWSASLGNPLSFFPTGGQAHAGKAPTRSCRT